MGFALDF
jgi:hypothetical protein